MTRLKGKVALITGGSSGIGEATVRLFVEEGASVMVADIQDDRGKRLADELSARAAYVHTDVSPEAHVKAAVDETCRRFGRLDRGRLGRRLRRHHRRAPSRGVPRHEARRARDEEARRRLHHQHRQRGRAPHGAGATHLQRGQSRRHPPHALGRHGAGRARCAGQLHLPRRHRHTDLRQVDGALPRKGGRDHSHDERCPGELSADQETRSSRRHRPRRPLAGQRRVDLRQWPRPRGGRRRDRRPAVVGKPAAPREAALRPGAVMSEPITVEKFAVGQSVRRVEDPHLVQGLGRYGDDVSLPRQAHAVVVRSTHAHARIRGIDASAALKAPGVIAVLTGADLAADGLGNLPTDGSRKRRDGSPAFKTPRPALAKDRARHVGDPIALVVAETAEEAVDGAAHVTRLDFVVTRVAAAPIEPRTAVGDYDRRSGRYTLHTGIQAPHGLRTLLAVQIFRVPQSDVRVITGEVGGSFGMKSGIYPELVLVLWAARRLGRPVKWTSERREGFLTDEHGRDNVSSAELALDKDGKFLGMRVALMVDIGAYLTPRSAGPVTNNVGGVAGVYTTPAIHLTSTGVFSNTTLTGPYRG